MDETTIDSCPSNQLRLVSRLLWDFISECLHPSERDVVKKVIGNLIIEENAAIYNEASVLAEILGDIQLNTNALLTRHQLCNSPQRKMVEAEIKLLLERIRSTANTTPSGSSIIKERDPQQLVPKNAPRQKAVLDYMNVVVPLQESSRPMTPGSRPGTATTRPGTASSRASRPSTAGSGGSGGSSAPDASALLASVGGQLNAYDVDAVVEVVLAALKEERGALLEDVEYFTGLLDKESDLQTLASATPPSLAELKQFSASLSQVCAQEEARVAHEIRVSAMFSVAEAEGSKVGRLRKMVDVSRQPANASLRPASIATYQSQEFPLPSASSAPLSPPTSPAAIATKGNTHTSVNGHSPPAISSPLAALRPTPSSPTAPTLTPSTSSPMNLLRSSSASRSSRPTSASMSSSILSPSLELRRSVNDSSQLFTSRDQWPPPSASSPIARMGSMNGGRGNKIVVKNVVEAMDMDVDALKGGVAAILAKHNVDRPNTASSRTSRPGTAEKSR